MGISPGTIHLEDNHILLKVRSKARRRNSIETAANQLGLFHRARIDDLIFEVITKWAFHRAPSIDEMTEFC